MLPIYQMLLRQIEERSVSSSKDTDSMDRVQTLIYKLNSKPYNTLHH